MEVYLFESGLLTFAVECRKRNLFIKLRSLSTGKVLYSDNFLFEGKFALDYRMKSNSNFEFKLSKIEANDFEAMALNFQLFDF